MPISATQLAANRRNAGHSTGPRTEEGKARSRANGLKHGLTGEGVVIPTEDVAEVERRAEALGVELKPSGEMARILVRRAAVLSVRLDRSVRQEFASVAERARNARASYDDGLASEVERMLSWITAEPATYARRLRQTPEGIDAVIGALLDVKADLMDPDGRSWHHGHFERVENLMGRRTSDFPASPIKAAGRAAWGDFSLLDPSEGEALGDLERRAWARDRVAEFIDAEVTRLRMIREGLDLDSAGRDRLEAGERALFDPSKEATLARKYEAATERSLFRTLRELREARPTPAEVAEVGAGAALPGEMGSSLSARARRSLPPVMPDHQPRQERKGQGQQREQRPGHGRRPGQDHVPPS